MPPLADGIEGEGMRLLGIIVAVSAVLALIGGLVYALGRKEK